MRRVHRMHLEHDVSGARQRCVGLQRGDHIVRCAHMHVVGGNQLGQWGLWPRARRLSWQHGGGKARGGAAQADIGQVQCLLAVIGNEQAARAHDAWGDAGRQRCQVRIDDRVLQV